MDRLDRSLGLHADALRWRGERLSVLASNIANAATPGYRARDLDFAVLMQRPAPASMHVTDPRHFPNAETAERPRLAWRIPLQPSLDGNTVELATEQLAFAENAVRYRSTLSVLNGRLSTLMSALKGE